MGPGDQNVRLIQNRLRTELCEKHHHHIWPITGEEGVTAVGLLLSYVTLHGPSGIYSVVTYIKDKLLMSHRK